MPSFHISRRIVKVVFRCNKIFMYSERSIVFPVICRINNRLFFFLALILHIHYFIWLGFLPLYCVFNILLFYLLSSFWKCFYNQANRSYQRYNNHQHSNILQHYIILLQWNSNLIRQKSCRPQRYVWKSERMPKHTHWEQRRKIRRNHANKFYLIYFHFFNLSHRSYNI